MTREDLPLLDDWKDGQPDAWDYEGVLKEHNVQVVWCDEWVDGEGTTTPIPEEYQGWSLSWPNGVMEIGQTSKIIARKAAALFVSLWLRNISASFADKLMQGYIWWLELQEKGDGDAQTQTRPLPPPV